MKPAQFCIGKGIKGIIAQQFIRNIKKWTKQYKLEHEYIFLNRIKYHAVTFYSSLIDSPVCQKWLSVLDFLAPMVSTHHSKNALKSCRRSIYVTLLVLFDNISYMGWQTGLCQCQNRLRYSVPTFFLGEIGRTGCFLTGISTPPNPLAHVTPYRLCSGRLRHGSASAQVCSGLLTYLTRNCQILTRSPKRPPFPAKGSQICSHCTLVSRQLSWSAYLHA